MVMILINHIKMSLKIGEWKGLTAESIIFYEH